MPTKIYSCSSTSTTDLHQYQINYSDSYSQTLINVHDDDEYVNYEEIYFQKSSISLLENNIEKSNQTTICRINHYSVACLTKPAYLLTN